MNTMPLAQMDWDRYGHTFQKAIFETLYMVSITLVISSVLGLIIGLLLYTTRKGGILQNRVVYWITNFLVNFIRPIPFIILLTAIGPLTDLVVQSRMTPPSSAWLSPPRSARPASSSRTSWRSTRV